MTPPVKQTTPKTVVATKKQTPYSKIKPAAKKTVAPSHPKFIDMVIEGIRHLNERSGSSRHALLKFIESQYHLNPKLANTHLKLALKSGVKSGALKQSKGIGAAGSFKIGDGSSKPVVVAKTTAKKVTTPKAKVVTTKPKVVKGEEKPKRNVTKKIVMPKSPVVAVAVVEKAKAKVKEVKVVPKPHYARGPPSARGPVAKNVTRKVVPMTGGIVARM